MANSTVFKAACVQMSARKDPAVNADRVAEMVREAASRGADLIMTPEMTNIINRPREAVAAAYRGAGLSAEVAAFFDAMGERYGASDLVIARAGAGSSSSTWRRWLASCTRGSGCSSTTAG